MESSEVLRTITTLNTRAVRAERLASKYEHELAVERQLSAQVKQELEDLSKVAEILYESNCRMGVVTDFLIRQQEIKQPEEKPRSFEVMFNLLMKQAEGSVPHQYNEESDIVQGPSAVNGDSEAV
ncbi:unnamed protein product [Penicillium pancosmium]